MNYSEQISAFETKRAGLVAANGAIMQKSATEGSTLDAAQKEEFDGNEADVAEIDEHLKRLRTMEKSSLASAKPVVGSDSQSGSESRGHRVEVKGVNLPKGTTFTRYAMALARSKGNLMQAAEIAKGWTDTPQVETILKAAVAAGTTTDTNWAQPLVEYENMASEFAELLRPQTDFGKNRGSFCNLFNDLARLARAFSCLPRTCYGSPLGA